MLFLVKCYASYFQNFDFFKLNLTSSYFELIDFLSFDLIKFKNYDIIELFSFFDDWFAKKFFFRFHLNIMKVMQRLNKKISLYGLHVFMNQMVDFYWSFNSFSKKICFLKLLQMKKLLVEEHFFLDLYLKTISTVILMNC